MFKAKRILWLYLLSILLVSLSNKVLGDVYYYSSYFSPPSANNIKEDLPVTINTEGTIYAGVYYSAEFCSEEIGYKCIISDILEMAVDSKKLSVDQSWIFKGKEYTVVRHYDDFELLGQSFETFLIASNLSNELVFQFLFSPDRGMVGFGYLNNNENGLGHFSWLKSDCGLFHSENCSYEKK